MLSRLGGACSGCVVPGAFSADVLVLAPGAEETNPLGIKFGACVGRPGPENVFEFGWPSAWPARTGASGQCRRVG